MASVPRITSLISIPAGDYLTGDNGVATNPGGPVLPLKSVNVTASNTVLRGVGLLGGHYTDTLNVHPLTSAAAAEISTGTGATTDSANSFGSARASPSRERISARLWRR